MKLELKHLAPYLPYGLKVIPNGSNKTCKVLGIQLDPMNIEIVRYGEIRESKVGFKWFKPLLLPLSTEYENTISENDLEITHCHSRLRLIAMAKTNGLYQFQFEHLVSRHFDVFGLIPAGLALNKMEVICS